MAKAAIGLFEDSVTADKVVAHLVKSGFPRDEVRLVRAVDFDGGFGKRNLENGSVAEG